MGLDLLPIHEPLSLPRSALLEVYTAIEGLRNDGKAQHERMRKRMRQLGMPIPDKPEDDSFLMMRAMEMLMISIGAGIVTDRRDDVLAAWALLVSATDADVSGATDRILSVEKMGRQMGEAASAWGAWLTAEDCAQHSTFVPAFVGRTLHLTR